MVKTGKYCNLSDTREISRTITVPAYDTAGGDAAKEVKLTGARERQYNDCPEVIPALAEWKGGQGDFKTGGSFRVIVEEGSTLQGVAELFRDAYNSKVRCSVEIVSGRPEDAEAGDFYLGYADSI